MGLHKRIHAPVAPGGFLLLLALGLATACNSQPAKYRKKKGCDCPHWNHVPAGRQEHHAASPPVGAPWAC